MSSRTARHGWFLTLVVHVEALSKHGWHHPRSPVSQAVTEPTPWPDSRPHIIFIVADDLGWNDLGMRNGDIQTPNIDNLAKHGVVLDSYYVQATCSPTRASFLTGRYPVHTGVGDAIEAGVPLGLPLNETTLASLLRARGYKAHMVGKWHLGSHSYFHTPTFRGFESFYGYYGGCESYFSHMTGDWYDFRRDSQEFCGRGCSQVNVDDADAYSTELFSKEAAHIITSHDQSSPLFLYLAYQAVHFPGEVPDSYSALYRKIDDPTRRVFAGMLTAMDLGIGKVIKALLDTEMMRNTLLVFTTDNGGATQRGSTNYPLRGRKGELFEGGVRGVGIVTAPGLAARKFSGLMHAVDWLPTLLQAAGPASSPDHTLPLDGVSMWEAIERDEDSPRTSIYLGRSYKESNTMFGPAVRAGDLKLVARGEWPDGSVETNHSVPLLVLFNITEDPNEKHDISLKRPQSVQKLQGLIEAYEKDSGCLFCPDTRCPEPKHDPSLLITLANGTTRRPLEPYCDDVIMEDLEADLEKLSLGERRSLSHLPAVQFLNMHHVTNMHRVTWNDELYHAA